LSKKIIVPMSRSRIVVSVVVEEMGDNVSIIVCMIVSGCSNSLKPSNRTKFWK